MPKPSEASRYSAYVSSFRSCVFCFQGMKTEKRSGLDLSSRSHNAFWALFPLFAVSPLQMFLLRFDADHMRWWQWDGAPMGSQGNRWAVYDDETRRPSFESFKTWMKWNISHAERSGDVLLSLEPEADGCGGDGRDWYCIE